MVCNIGSQLVPRLSCQRWGHRVTRVMAVTIKVQGGEAKKSGREAKAKKNGQTLPVPRPFRAAHMLVSAFGPALSHPVTFMHVLDWIGFFGGSGAILYLAFFGVTCAILDHYYSTPCIWGSRALTGAGFDRTPCLTSLLLELPAGINPESSCCLTHPP
ncbi:hypothetical protein EDB87DRAFT_1157307 [Lactarius vividus]|nr:hypothetical protein EDB87DRAFT_1157307 [Lactarius vividus]